MQDTIFNMTLYTVLTKCMLIFPIEKQCKTCMSSWNVLHVHQKTDALYTESSDRHVREGNDF